MATWTSLLPSMLERRPVGHLYVLAHHSASSRICKRDEGFAKHKIALFVRSIVVARCSVPYLYIVVHSGVDFGTA